MRHRKKTQKLQRTTSHRRALFANMLKSLVYYDRIKTTLPKAKALKSRADKLITLAKKNTLASRRTAIADLMIRYNKLDSKQMREAKNGDTTCYNIDRQVINKLFDVLSPGFSERQGGYTRIIPGKTRVGDNAKTCYLEWVDIKQPAVEEPVS